MIQYYSLAPIWNGTQFFDADGNPLAGGKIGTYVAGSSSFQAVTYSDKDGEVDNTNPIVLDSSGRIPTEIWLDQNFNYNFILYQPDGETVIQSCDNVGVFDPWPDTIGQEWRSLTVDENQEVSWQQIIPNVAGNAGKVLSTSGETSGSPLSTLSWISAGGGGDSAETLVVKLSNTELGYMNRTYSNQWSPEVLLSSSVADWDSYSNQLRLDSAGVWRVTVKAWTQPNDEYGMPGGPTAYGTYVGNTADGRNYSQYYRNAVDNDWGYLGADAQLSSWADEFIIDARADSVSYIDILLFEERYMGASYAYNYGAIVTATKLAGTFTPPM